VVVEEWVVWAAATVVEWIWSRLGMITTTICKKLKTEVVNMSRVLLN
jgi:hypothetical protein